MVAAGHMLQAAYQCVGRIFSTKKKRVSLLILPLHETPWRLKHSNISFFRAALVGGLSSCFPWQGALSRDDDRRSYQIWNNFLIRPFFKVIVIIVRWLTSPVDYLTAFNKAAIRSARIDEQ
jgi:hypothetical protein